VPLGRASLTRGPVPWQGQPLARPCTFRKKQQEKSATLENRFGRAKKGGEPSFVHRLFPACFLAFFLLFFLQLFKHF
jgi:hypothetical protein